MIDAAMRGPFGEIAVAPDIGEALEIGGAVFRAVGIVPEADRHRRERLGADQFALFAGAPACRPRPRHRRPCRGPAPGSRRVQTGTVGTPRTKQETMSVPPEIEARCTSGLIAVIDEVEAFRRQRRAGRGHRAHASTGRGVSRRREPRLAHRIDVFRRGAEIGHPLAVRHSRTGCCRRDGRASRRRAAASRRGERRRPASSTSSSRRW